jgi:hypothetical protein
MEGSMKMYEKKVKDRKIKVSKGKKFVITDSKCAICSEGSNISKNGQLKKHIPKTCYSINSLLKMAKAYNEEHTDKIPIEGLSKMELWNIIRNKLVGVCSYDENCWRKQEFVKKLKDMEIDLYTFKTTYPKEWKKNPHEWLSTYDILYVMKQYEKANDDFVFLGVVPADCPMKINCELTNLDFKKMMKQGIHKIGIVTNLDTHDMSGSHWTAIYISLPYQKGKGKSKSKKKNIAQINYYDSYGVMDSTYINQFMELTAKKMKKMGMEPVIIYNDKRHQYDNYSCGVYSMNFILERLHGTSMYEISKMNILSSEMNYLRKVLYMMEDNKK